jgi:hypothetical protein
MSSGTSILRAGVLVAVLAAPVQAYAQLAPNAPADKPIPATSEQARRMDAAIAPYIEHARKTYPEAKARYLAGLPTGETLYATARVTDPQGHFEVVFVRVTKIADGKIMGRIANEILSVSGYKEGDEYTLAEAELVDWTISKPDGTEEGNVVGKFLEAYQP